MRIFRFFNSSVFIVLACSLVMPLYAQAKEESRPAIYQAIEKNDSAKAKAAIDSGDDVNAVYDRDTLLCWSIRRNRPEISKLIIQSPKVDVNKRGVLYDDFSDWERTPLIQAAHMGQTEIVDLLIKKGADMNARDRADNAPLARGNTALIKAAQRNQMDTVQVFFTHSKKPSVNLQGSEGKTAFWFAVEKENLEMVKLLYSNGSKVNLTDNSGRSVLTATILHKKYDVLDFLVSKGADINLADNGGLTPIMTAINSRNADPARVFKYLEKFLTFKPKLDTTQIKKMGGGYSALHLASRFGFVDVVKLLLDNGANINIVSLATGGTPLHTAASSKNNDVAKYLMERGAKREIQDLSGATPLITAVMQADPDMVEVLIEGGAVINIRSSVNILITPLNLATAKLDPFTHKKCIKIMKLLLDNKGDINFKASDGRTALMVAAASSDHSQGLEKGTLLIDRGAKIDSANTRGETALMLAAGSGNEDFVELLLDKGADIHLKNGSGESVMTYANRSGKKAIITLLESKGAKPDAPIARKKVIVNALVGTWQGYQDGLPQAVFKIVFKKDSTFDFVSRLTPAVLKKLPAGSVNPVIAAQKGTYTFNNDILILDLVGAAPLSRKWKLVNKVLILDDLIRLKKIK